MKKFSWIFALVLALSIGFIGCPSDGGEDEGGGGGEGGGGAPSYQPNPEATKISVIFGVNDTEVLNTKTDGTAIGTVTYIPGTNGVGNGYKYTYGTLVDDEGYGQAIQRFKVDLGEFNLGDYYIFLKWKGTGGDVGFSNTNKQHPEYTKNLFILASKSGNDLTAYKNDTGQLQSVMVNTRYFEGANSAEKPYAGGAGVPAVKGQGGYEITAVPDYTLEPYEITTKILRKETITGEIWLSVYFYAAADGGSFEVTDFALIPLAGVDYNTVKKDPPAPPPAIPPSTDPTEIPSEYSTFDLVLSGALTATSSPDVSNGSNAGSTSTFADGKLTSVFSTNGMRLVFPLTTEQKTLLGTGPDAQTDIYIKLEGTVKTDGDPSGNLFRYSLAQKDEGGGWATTTLPEGKLETLLLKKVTWSPQDHASAPDSFILQHRNGNEITIEITKITIGYMPGATVTGIAVRTEPTNNIYQVNVTKFDPSGLVITATYSDNTTRDVAYAHDAGFTFSMTAGGGTVPLIPTTTVFPSVGNTTVTVNYEGASATYIAVVSEDTPPEVVSFTIKTQPTKTAYKKGIDSFNPAGLEITATYNKALQGGGLTKEIAYDTNADDFEFANGTTELEVGESKFDANATITVTYEEKTATFAITVSDITAIAVKTPPTLASYEVGFDKFSAAGLVITATYGTAGNEDVTYAGHTADFAFSTEEGDLTVGTSTFDAIASTVEITVTYKTLTTTFNIAVTALVTGPVWTPVINESTALNGSGEYIGQTGIKRDSAASEIAFGVLDDAFTVTVTNGQYKQFCVQVGTAAGGTNYWCNDGFIAKTGKSYTITFMVSVDSTTATGQIRACKNNNDNNWEKDQALTDTPTAFTYTWTQGSGNLKFDTGNTAVDGVITITGISISAN